MSKTFNENLEWLRGYICRDNEAIRNLTVLSRLSDLKASHEEELEAAMGKFPFVEYDVAENERHKVACALRTWEDDEVVRESAEDHLYMLYMKLYNEFPGDEPHEKLAIAIRDRLIGLLEA